MLSAHEIMNLGLAATALVLIRLWLRETARTDLRLFTIAFYAMCGSIVCAVLERLFAPLFWNVAEHFCYAASGIGFVVACRRGARNRGRSPAERA